MNRREALIRMATLMGATVVGPRLLSATLQSPPNGTSPSGFSANDIVLLDEIGETIIPATDVPGAKAVQIGAFIAMMVDDCYETRDQAVFKQGLTALAAAHQTRFGKTFLAGSVADRTALLNSLDQEQKTFTEKKGADDPPHYFRMMKELTILGYFTSEIGATQGVRFIEVPGSYDGCAPYKKGERAWFS